METITIPGRPSDAGPLPEAQNPINRQALYGLLVEEVMEDVHELSRCSRDDRRQEQLARLMIISRILDTFQKIQEVV